MNKREIRAYANQRIRELVNEGYTEVIGWSFDFNKRRTHVGLCSYRKKTIFYSEYYIGTEAENVKNTINHELAHVLAGPGNGHGPKWKQMCKVTGCTDNRMNSTAVVNKKPKYAVVYVDGTDHKMVASCSRKLVRLDTRSIIGQPETRGKLWMVCYEEYTKVVNGMKCITRARLIR